MNYKESRAILKEVEKAKRILLSCHRSPDADSAASALSMRKVLKKLGKEVDVFCSTEFPKRLEFLPGSENVVMKDFSKLNYEKYDLFITLDSSTYDQATDQYDIPPGLRVIVIDHHRSNKSYGGINLIDAKATSVCEMLFGIFNDWKVDYSKDVSYLLLSGIVEDSGAFKFPGTSSKTLMIASKLMEKGANFDEIIFNTYFTIDIKQFKFWSMVFDLLKMDKKHKFAWAAVDYDKYEEYKPISGLRQSTSTAFFQSFKGTNFAIFMVEKERGKLSVGLRSRSGIDVSKVATDMGGGGHQYASGFGVEGLPFDKAVEKVLKIAREFAKKNNK